MLVVGGGAIALAYSNDRATRDIDAIFEPKMLSTKRPRQWPTRWGFHEIG